MFKSMAATDGCLSFLKRAFLDGNTLLFMLVQKEQLFAFSSICYFSSLCSQLELPVHYFTAIIGLLLMQGIV